MKLYGIPNCSTVKKARVWLDANGIVYAFHDFKKQGVDEATLTRWLAQQPWETLINRSGTTWRGLSDAEKAGVVDHASARALMQAYTSVIKRPLLEQEDRLLAVGFDEARYATLLKP
ncbi:ArsC family reductase [Methylobacillus flagellatus]|uniref:ArsC family reductase n=1 Tax=Methylobacillus flagellatus TaxID=405 RepID=UPI0010F58A09|nr:ArsC family reductase [Methylobacillus flagellatus]